MKKHIQWLIIICCMGVLLSCGFEGLENKADEDIYRGTFDYGYKDKHSYLKNEALRKIQELDTYVAVEEQKAIDEIAVTSQARITQVKAMTKTQRNPSSVSSIPTTAPTSYSAATWPQACCWAANQRNNSGDIQGALAPDDTGNKNNYGDNNYPYFAADPNTTGTRWASNYTRAGAGAHDGALDDGHWITFDLGANYTIVGFQYRGRQNDNGGKVTGLDLYVSQTNDLARDPSNTNTGNHPGHNPPAAKLVPHNQTSWPAASGDNGWYPSSATANIEFPAYGRYVQFRLNKTALGSTQAEKGASGLRIVTVGNSGTDELASVRSGPALAKAAAQAAALAQLRTFVDEGGYSNGVVDFSYLEVAYNLGIQVLATMKPEIQPIRYNKLNAALQLALPYLRGEVNPPAPFSPTSAQLASFDAYSTAFRGYLTSQLTTSFYGYQAQVDNITENIMLLVEEAYAVMGGSQ